MTVSGSELKSILERIEKLEDEKQNLQEDIKEVYKEARFKGFEPKIIKVILKVSMSTKSVPPLLTKSVPL